VILFSVTCDMYFVRVCEVCFVCNTQKYDTHFAAVLLSVKNDNLQTPPVNTCYDHLELPFNRITVTRIAELLVFLFCSLLSSGALTNLL